MKSCLPLCLLTVILLAGCSDKSGVTPPATDHVPSEDPHAALPGNVSTKPRIADPPGEGGGVIELGEVALTAPAQWSAVEPSSSFVAAEFSLPRAEGDDADGRLTVSTAGGTVDANIERWKGQFGSQPQQESLEEIEVAGIKATVVDLSGDFSDQRGPFAPAVERTGYRMIAAIIPVDSQLHFIKATGPEKTIAAHAEEIRKFIRTAEPAK